MSTSQRKQRRIKSELFLSQTVMLFLPNFVSHQCFGRRLSTVFRAKSLVPSTSCKASPVNLLPTISCFKSHWTHATHTSKITATPNVTRFCRTVFHNKIIILEGLMLPKLSPLLLSKYSFFGYLRCFTYLRWF